MNAFGSLRAAAPAGPENDPRAGWNATVLLLPLFEGRRGSATKSGLLGDLGGHVDHHRRSDETARLSWSTHGLSFPVTQWQGASKCVPTCSPISIQFQYQAGPLASKCEISWILKPGVFAKGGGSWMIGVAGLSSCVRSTTVHLSATPAPCQRRRADSRPARPRFAVAAVADHSPRPPRSGRTARATGWHAGWRRLAYVSSSRPDDCVPRDPAVPLRAARARVPET